MRLIFLLIVFVGFLIGVQEAIDIYTNQKKEINELTKKTSLAEKVKIPAGLEKEYQLILAGKSPFGENTNPLLTKIVLNESPKPHVEKKEIVKTQHEIIKTKLKKSAVKNDSLVVDLLLYNNSEKIFEDKVKILCVSYNVSGELIDSFSVNKNLSMKSKETLLLKDLGLGYAIMNNQKELWCYVE